MAQWRLGTLDLLFPEPVSGLPQGNRQLVTNGINCACQVLFAHLCIHPVFPLKEPELMSFSWSRTRADIYVCPSWILMLNRGSIAFLTQIPHPSHCQAGWENVV